MISSETVTRLVKRMSSMTGGQAQAAVKQMTKEQPFILAFLLAVSKNKAFDRDEGEIFFYIGMTTWQIIRQDAKYRRRITEGLSRAGRKVSPQSHEDTKVCENFIFSLLFLRALVPLWQMTGSRPSFSERAEKANEVLLEKMASDSSGDFLSAAESIVKKYPEPEVLRYVTEALMEDKEGNPENPPIRDEKIVLDAFVGGPA